MPTSRLLPTVLACWLAAAPAPGQDEEEVRPLSEAGVVSREPQPIGDPALGVFTERFSDEAWQHLETTHFRIASSLEAMRLTGADRKRMAGELDELRLYFPELSAKPRELEAEIYIVLIGMRLEKLYAEFQRLADVADEDFPASRAAQGGRGPYMGDGPYLGEREKFEVVLHADRREHNDFTKWQRGVVVRDTMRWHNREPSKLIVSMPCIDGDLRKDRWLWPHLAHNVAHMLFDGFKFFAYDPPLWLAEGLALWFEKAIEAESWTRDGGEGVFFEPSRSEGWADDARKLARKEDHPSLPVLMAAKGPGDLDRDAHVTCWSITSFLIEAHPDGYARLIGGLKAQLDEQGYPTGADLDDLQRSLLREIWGWTPMQLEQAWLAWLLGGDGG